MVRRIIIATAILGSLAVAACNTVRGVASDVNSAADCTQNAMHGGRC